MMRKLRFNDSWALAEEIDKVFHLGDEQPIIVAVGRYEFARTLLQNLIVMGYEISLIVELEDVECCGYDDEYYVTVDSYGVSVEKAYDAKGERYLFTEGTHAYIHEDCNSAILKKVETTDTYEVEIDALKDEKEEPKQCECEKAEEPDDTNEYAVCFNDIIENMDRITNLLERLLM